MIERIERVERVLIVGGGGREHALAWRCRSEGHDVWATPGSDAIAREGVVCVPSPDAAAIVALAQRESITLCVVGPEQPLVDGLADQLREAGIPTFGPGAAAAQLEGSKAAAKAFMDRHGIPTAAFVTCESLAEALAAVRRFDRPPVVKASGLAAGKGVTVPDSFADAEAAIRECMDDDRFGAAGSTVVLEERLLGQEASFFVLTDGVHAATLPACQDHKRLLDGDLGPNTGGMGAYCPAPIVSADVHQRVMARIVRPTLDGLRGEGRPFVGVLFIGLMIDDAGDPRVIEYNVRFGDPEAQPLMFGLQEDLVPHLVAAADGTLRDHEFRARPACSVVMASAGYPRSATKGVPIIGLLAPGDEREPDVKVFHAGTRADGDAAWVTNGGRVLGACGRADDLAEAIARAYATIDALQCEGAQVRRDIGARAL